MQCGGCTTQLVQQVPILLNPAVWIIAVAAISGVIGLGKKKTDNKK